MDESPNIEQLMRTQRWAEAREAIRNLLIQRPTDARLHAMEGICLFRMNDFAAAEPCFGRATALDPRFVDAGVKQCQCLDRMRRYDEALAMAREWLRQRPSDVALQAIVEAHQYRRDPLRTDGWERTQHLYHEARFASDL